MSEIKNDDYDLLFDHHIPQSFVEKIQPIPITLDNEEIQTIEILEDMYNEFETNRIFPEIGSEEFIKTMENLRTNGSIDDYNLILN